MHPTTKVLTLVKVVLLPRISCSVSLLCSVHDRFVVSDEVQSQWFGNESRMAIPE